MKPEEVYELLRNSNLLEASFLPKFIQLEDIKDLSDARIIDHVKNYLTGSCRLTPKSVRFELKI